MRLSVIVCVYNAKVEQLDKCLGSICTSTLEDYEVLVVDDGSDTDYGEIVEKYHPVYVKTSNRGQLAARTYGLMLAKGEYVAFVDSDDTVTFNYHAPMVDEAVNGGCDIVINDWAFKTGSAMAYCKEDSTINSNIELENDEILKQFALYQGRQHSYFVLWNKIFKRELLLKAKAEIEKTDVIMKKQTYSEDMLITFFAFKNAKKLKNIHTGYYFYHVHDSQSIVADTSEKIAHQVDAVTKNFSIMESSIGENKYASEILSNINEWKGMMSRTHYSYAKAQGDKGLCDYIKQSYGVEKLVPPTLKDSQSYIASGLLGDDFEGIDTIFRWICKKGQDVSVNYDKSDEYVAKSIGYLAQKKGIKITYSKDAQLIMPKRKNSLKNKLFHNKLVCKVGMALFPKGSGIRKALKNKL
ncbi:MAG: glycosyltransferase family 2 protein [Ruminococcaceae bacterium]|nr:glycosyltransferase family 2 protein [Oscillospiraceae bacterium]